MERKSLPVSSLAMEGVDLEDFIHTDAYQLMQHFRESFEDWKKNLRHANVLISGVTGAGKSSVMINSMFGKDTARVGCGEPITQHFTRYEQENKNVVIYDSKGLEYGEHVAFIDETKKFFKDHQVQDPRNSIHVIWYVINSGNARFQPFEEKICREVFNIAPIIFLLNKADISTDDERRLLRETITGMKLPNCIGIFDTISHSNAKLPRMEVCPRCGGDDIVIKTKQKLLKCHETNCRARLSLDPRGLEAVVQTTIEALPKVAREAFISAQQANFIVKDQRAIAVINDFCHEYRHCRVTSSLISVIAKMLTRLSILWEFRDHCHLYGMFIAKNLVKRFNFRDKVFLFMHKHHHQLNRIIALGIVWNRCLRLLAKELFYECFHQGLTVEQIESIWPMVLERAFHDLNDDTLTEIEELVEKKGLVSILNVESTELERKLTASESELADVPYVTVDLAEERLSTNTAKNRMESSKAIANLVDEVGHIEGAKAKAIKDMTSTLVLQAKEENKNLSRSTDELGTSPQQVSATEPNHLAASMPG
eukprot:CAMPEP_0177632414 /NCGR_PEP_ID=MMETSP0447-20121125/2278_1 /TAXON_ID=0 /ORGANISM="Stygamoeba regulata, Strain BSH-02190019" /LENGTH=537 /DNA_ID=CAMNT_0019133979 /DNA_START=181 /DNA_END=1794 /DNA_ORIENTATION=+